MLRNAFLLLLLVALGCKPPASSADQAAPAAPSTAPAGIDLTAAAKGNATLTNGMVTLTTSSKYAGAISSLTFGGKEFINVYDHGRELQFASFEVPAGQQPVSNNDAGCLNPNQAGGGYDANKATSSSVLNTFSATKTAITMVSHPAYWMKPGTSDRSCGTARNTTLTTPEGYTETLTLGPNGMKNVIQVDLQMYIPPGVSFASIDMSLAAFLVGDFTGLQVRNPNGVWGIAQVPEIYNWSLPLLMSTANQKFAFAIYVPPKTQPGILYSYNQIGKPKGNDSVAPTSFTTEFDVAYWHQGPTTAGTYNYTAFVVVGNVAMVQATVSNLGHFFGAF